MLGLLNHFLFTNPGNFFKLNVPGQGLEQHRSIVFNGKKMNNIIEKRPSFI
jgi:hypothetical protein